MNDKKIDLLKCTDVPQKGIQSCATIGLNRIDLGLLSNNNSLKVEVVGASDISIQNFENILATVAFEIMDSHEGFPGYIVENVIEEYMPNCEMKHILLTNPFLWEEAKSITYRGITIAWLMMVPISEREYNYACENGVEALEDMFQEKDIDIYDMYRKSVI